MINCKPCGILCILAGKNVSKIKDFEPVKHENSIGWSKLQSELSSAACQNKQIDSGLPRGLWSAWPIFEVQSGSGSVNFMDKLNFVTKQRTKGFLPCIST
jgi:hypothetical protein